MQAQPAPAPDNNVDSEKFGTSAERGYVFSILAPYSSVIIGHRSSTAPTHKNNVIAAIAGHLLGGGRKPTKAFGGDRRILELPGSPNALSTLSEYYLREILFFFIFGPARLVFDITIYTAAL